MKAPQLPYVHQDYPKHLYHRDGRSEIVANAIAHQLLGAGWYESPADAANPEAAVAVAPVAAIIASVSGAPGQPPLSTDTLRTLLAEAEAREAHAATELERLAVEQLEVNRQVQDAKQAADRAMAERASGADREVAEMQAIYAATETSLIASTVSGASPENLNKLRAIESANPAGARKAVIKAVEKALAKLAPKE